MNKKEAAHQLQSILDAANMDDCNAKEIDAFDEEAINIAIKALKREQQFLDAGYKNERVEFYIGGRKFMVKELAQ